MARRAARGTVPACRVSDWFFDRWLPGGKKPLRSPGACGWQAAAPISSADLACLPLPVLSTGAASPPWQQHGARACADAGGRIMSIGQALAATTAWGPAAPPGAPAAPLSAACLHHAQRSHDGKGHRQCLTSSCLGMCLGYCQQIHQGVRLWRQALLAAAIRVLGTLRACCLDCPGGGLTLPVVAPGPSWLGYWRCCHGVLVETGPAGTIPLAY
jgi:hypothetical protein